MVLVRECCDGGFDDVGQQIDEPVNVNRRAAKIGKAQFGELLGHPSGARYECGK